MSFLILPERYWDSAHGAEEISQELRKMYGLHGRCERHKESWGTGCFYVAFIVAMDASEPMQVEHPLQDGPATLEWWQSYHTLTGFGMAPTLAEATVKAFGCAKRGNLQRFHLTVWRNRLTGQYSFFDRSLRDPEENYRPVGRQMSRTDLELRFSR